jgi:hypothetical protein
MFKITLLIDRYYHTIWLNSFRMKSLRIVCLQAVIWTWDLANRKQCLPLGHDFSLRHDDYELWIRNNLKGSCCVLYDARNQLMNTVLPFEKLIVAQLIKKLLVLYGTQRFITVFTKSRHWVPILSQINPISFGSHNNKQKVF